MTTQANKKEFWFAVLVTLIGLGAVLPAQTVSKAEAAAAAVTVQPVATPGAKAGDPVGNGTESVVTPVVNAPVKVERKVVVSLADRKLAVVEDGEVKAIYTVAVGKASTPSPVGEFTIVSRVANPTYTHDGKVVKPGPGNPVGTRWMGLSVKGYGIHGTNVPSSIGKAASHGCIRVGRKDLEQLFTMVQVGDVVEIRGERDAEAAAIFGSGDGAPTLVRTEPALRAAEDGAPKAAGMRQGQE